MLLRLDPFHRLTIGGVFDRSIEVFRADPIAFLSIGAISAIPGLFINWFVVSNMDKLMSLFSDMTDMTTEDQDETIDKMFDIFIEMISTFLVVLIIAFIVSVVLKVAIIRASIQIYIKQKPELMTNLEHGVRLLCRLFCLGLAYMCGMFGLLFVFGLFMILVTGLLSAVFDDSAMMFLVVLMLLVLQVAVFYYATYSFIFWDVVVVVEDLPGFRPFVRSYHLVKGQWCFIFCALFLEGLALVGVFLIEGVLFSGLGVLGSMIAHTLMGVVITPYMGIFLTVLYLNSRGGEGCNSTVLAREMNPDSTGNTAGAFSAVETDFDDSMVTSKFVDGKTDPMETMNVEMV